MSFPSNNQDSSSNPGGASIVEVRSSDSADSDLIIVSIHESNNFLQSENARHGPSSEGEPKYRPDSGGSGAEPMEVATSGHMLDAMPQTASTVGITMSSSVDHVETGSCAAMSVDCERSSSGGSDSGGAGRSNFPTIMEHTESPTVPDAEHSSEAGSGSETARGKLRKLKHPVRFPGGQKTAEDSPSNPVPLAASPSSPSSPKLVISYDAVPEDLSQHPPQSQSVEQQQQQPVLVSSSKTGQQRSTRPSSASNEVGAMTVNLIPAAQVGQQHHVRFSAPPNSNMVFSLQPPQVAGHFGVAAPTRLTISRQQLQQQQIQMQSQHQQMLMAMRQQQLISQAANRPVAPNLPISQPRLVLKPAPPQQQPILIAPKVPGFRLSLNPQQSSAQIPISMVAGLAPAIQQALVTSIASTSAFNPQMPQQQQPPVQTFPTISTAPQVVTTSTVKVTTTTPAVRPPAPVQTQATSSKPTTQLIDSLAAKLQIQMPLLTSSSSAATLMASNSAGGVQCAICSMTFPSNTELEKHLERKSLVLRYNNSTEDSSNSSNSTKDELVFYNKCALLYHFRRQKSNFHASKLTIGYYLPPLKESAKSQAQKKPVEPPAPAPKSVPPSPTPATSTEPDKKTPKEPPKCPTVSCPECEKDLPITSQKKNGLILALEEHFQRFEGDILVCRKCDVPVTNLCQAAAHARLHRSSSSLSQNRFVCPNCGQSSQFDDFAALLAHLYGSCMAQMRFLGYRCLFCQFVSRDISALFKHCVTTHVQSKDNNNEESAPNNGLKCPNCDVQIPKNGQDSAALTSAILNHGLAAPDCSFRPFSIREICKHCGRIFHSGSTMRAHIEKTHPGQVAKISKTSVPFYCALCRKNVPVTATVHVQEAHQVDTSANEPFSWLDTFSTVDRDYLLSVAANATTKLCSICDNLIPGDQEKSLDHIATHFDRICPLCFGVFDNVASLTEHRNQGDCLGGGQDRNKKKDKRRPKSFQKRKRRKSMMTISENEQLSSASPLLYSFNCFQCKESNVFQDMDDLEIHIRTVHRSADPTANTSSSSTNNSNEEASSKRSSSSAFGSTPTKGVKRSRQSLDALTPFVCVACGHVAMSKGSLEAHERKCQRSAQLPSQDRSSPLGLRSSTATSSSPLPQSGTSSAMSTSAPLQNNEQSQPVPESVSSSAPSTPASNSKNKPSTSLVNEPICCTLCSAEFGCKSDFISHMSRHISDSNNNNN